MGPLVVSWWNGGVEVLWRERWCEGLRFLAAVARVAMSRGKVCKCGGGSCCEGRIDVNNAVCVC